MSLKIPPKTSYEMQKQNLRREYCIELIKQRWLLDGPQIDVNMLVAQILRLFSNRYDIERATTRIAEQLAAVASSPEEEVRATPPRLTCEDTYELVETIRRTIIALIAKSNNDSPSDCDFRETELAIASALGSRRYFVVHSNMALDRNRRRRRYMEMLRSPREKDDKNG